MKLIRAYRSDIIAVLLLICVWLLFFSRLLTSNPADQMSIREGDFSAQFFSFADYQYERLTNGEIPLWNPYNNGGLPFIADPQAAVFYPPRLLSISASAFISDAWTYNALQMEVIAHVALYSLLMYAFVRRLTMGNEASPYGAFIAAIVSAYGGFMTGYAPLQLAILEAGTWLPLALLGILEATRHPRIAWAWVMLAGWALGLSWMAGHPQTSWMASLTVAAYLSWRALWPEQNWRSWLLALLLLGLITLGTTAVQLLPAAEYLGQTMRSGLGFGEKSGGFPPQDLIQFVIPDVISLFSPLYIGVTGISLAMIGLFAAQRDRWFFALLALLALALSLGAHSIVYRVAYSLLPGANAFRSQERAAYLVMSALSILAGLGTVTAMSRPPTELVRRVRLGISGLTLSLGLITGAIFVGWLAKPDDFGAELGPVAFSTIIAACLVLLLPPLMTGGQRNWRLMLGLLVAFEVLSVTVDSPNTYEPVPAASREIVQTPPLVQRALDDAPAGPLRVDGGIVRGEIGIYGRGNAGSQYGIADIRGISPLFLDGPHALIMRDMPAPVAWEVFAVRYVFTDAEELPVDSELIARDYPDGQTLNLHRLSDPRPFALLTYDYVVAPDDAAAREILRDPQFDPRQTLILERESDLPLPEQITEGGVSDVENYAPESFDVRIDTRENALLSVAQVDYAGWEIRLDGEELRPIRAYGSVMAVAIPAGQHVVSFRYDPLSFKLGAALSLVTWGGLCILGLALWGRLMMRHLRSA